MRQDLQTPGHLVLELHDARVVVAIQAGPLDVNVAKPAGIVGSGVVIGGNGSPSRLIGCSVKVIKVPAISPFRPDVRDSDHRIVRDFLLDIKQVTMDIRRGKRLLLVSVKRRFEQRRLRNSPAPGR